MKRAALAVLFLSGLSALARADEGAYRSLVGMADAAAAGPGSDVDDGASASARRPENGKAASGGRAARAAEADGLKDAVADSAAPRRAAPAPGASGPASASARPEGDAPWARLYASLIPSWRRRASSEAPAVSTATAAASAARPTPAQEAAVRAGERRGLSELMSAAAAPAGE